MKIPQLLFLSLLTLWTRVVFADANTTISAAEYFVDTDPGEGNGTALTAQDGTFDSEVESIAPVDLNVTGLAVGPHLIGIRYKDDNNTWGEVLYQTIHVYDPNPNVSGSGGGGAGGSSAGFATIKGAEYFVDTDPGEGNGTAFQAQDGAFDSEVESILPKDLNVTGLSVGPHLVGVRYKDNNNTWGEVLYQTIHVYDANPSGSGSGGSGGGGSGGASGGFASISAAEYFVDTDPGAGSGIAFQAKDGAFDSEVESILPKDLNVTGLNVGPHLVGVRYKDNNNTWGEVLYQTIHVYDANPSGSGSGGSGGGGSGGASGGFASISAAEYFVDTDPGAGSGIAFQAKDGAFDSEVESILPKDLNVTGLSVGPHLVGVRYKDNNNTWGEVLYQTIHVYDANPDINNGGSGGSGGTGGFTVIAGAEYFIGNDPGEGNATALQPKDGAFDSEVESTLTASLSLEGYAIGAYLVGVRYVDNNGTWGDVLFKTIEVDVDTDGDGLADKAEAFYDTNATVQDTDGDGYLDGEEVAFGSNPKDANSLGNRAPTDLNATTVLSILENQAIGTFITEFNATDTDANNTLTYSLADGNGSGSNPFFTLDPNGTLVSAVIFDYENNASSYSIRVRVSDQHGYKMEGNFSISLLDLNEAPTDLNTTAPLQVAENQPVGTVVGQLTAHDPDAGTTQTFTLVGGEYDNHFFTIDTNGSLQTNAIFDYEANSTLTIQAKVRDQHNLWIKQNFIVQILNVVEDLDGDGIEDAYDTDDDGDGYSDADEIAYGSDPRNANSTADTLPTALTLSSLEIMENKPIGTVVGQFTVIDPDINDSHIVKFNDINANISHNHLFTIDANNTLRTAVVFDYENNSSTLYLRVKAKQNQVGVFWKFFTLSLLDDPSDDFIPPSDNNQTSTPIIDHNTTGDHNATQPPVIEQNGTISQNPSTDQNNTVIDNNSTQPRKEYLAILRTLDSRNEQNGTSRLYGKILTDGGSIISEKGFLVSTNLQFLNSERISGIDHNQTDPFFADYQTTQNDQTFYYRAFVRNNVGESLGGIKKIFPSALLSSSEPGWWNELPEIAGGWRTSPWFGSFRPYPGGWLYHVDLGWLFSHAGESKDLWLWNEQLGWHWTTQGVYPHIFQHSYANWLYFLTKRNGRPYFYDYDTGKLK